MPVNVRVTLVEPVCWFLLRPNLLVWTVTNARTCLDLTSTKALHHMLIMNYKRWAYHKYQQQSHIFVRLQRNHVSRIPLPCFEEDKKNGEKGREIYVKYS